MAALFIAAFITGLVGSFHCVGMCGPIALALPVAGNSFIKKLSGRLLYNAGRIFTYGVLGALLGAFGFGLKLAGMQQSVSIAAGVLMLTGVLFKKKWSSKISVHIFSNSSVAKLFNSRSLVAMFAIGLINGLLPCGFIYVALVASVATQSPWQGSVFMMLFGAGTFPLMFSVSMIGSFLSTHLRAHIRNITPAIAVLIAVVFILRGMNLGIPYISPQISVDQNTVKECCKP